jgi:hypothetical protein
MAKDPTLDEMITNEMNFYRDQFISTKDTQWLVKRFQMERDDKVKLVPKHTGKTSWIQTDRGSKCCKCGVRYEAPERIFLKDSKGWHTDCATVDEKASCNAYQKFLRDGAVRAHKKISMGASAPVIPILKNAASIEGAYDPLDFDLD